MQAYGEVIDLRLASSGGRCFSATRDYSILLLRCFRSRKCSDAMPPALVPHRAFMSPARGEAAVRLTKTMPVIFGTGNDFIFQHCVFACSRSLTIMQ